MLADLRPGFVMTLRLLVVDDHRDVVDGLKLLLEHAGFEVKPAYSGQQAIEAAQSFHPDVFILDLGMPGMDGFQVATQLRATPEFANKVFVALSGYAEQDRLDEAAQARFDEYLVKPPSMETLLAILAEVSE